MTSSSCMALFHCPTHLLSPYLNFDPLWCIFYSGSSSYSWECRIGILLRTMCGWDLNHCYIHSPQAMPIKGLKKQENTKDLGPFFNTKVSHSRHVGLLKESQESEQSITSVPNFLFCGPVPHLFVISLYSIVISVPDPYFDWNMTHMILYGIDIPYTAWL